MDLLIVGKRPDPAISIIGILISALFTVGMSLILAVTITPLVANFLSPDHSEESAKWIGISLLVYLLMAFVAAYGSFMTSEAIMSFIKARQSSQEKDQVTNAISGESENNSFHEWLTKIYSIR